MSPIRRRILYLDDHEDSRIMLAVLLTGAGYEVETVSAAREAWARAQAFNLLILDFKLPDGDGIALCRQIREFDPLTPVIIYSGMARESDREAAYRAGANAFVAKPGVADLLREVKSLLS